MNLPCKSLLGLAFLLAGLAPANAAGEAERVKAMTPLSEMSAAQKKQDQQYHLKAYAALTAAQKTVYRTLAAAP